MTIRELINNADFDGLKQALSNNPALANEGLPFDENNAAKAPPLHRISDGVFSKQYSDEDGATMAKLFLDFGAQVDGGKLIEKQDSPLVAAASLHADKVALLLIEHGATINHPGCHGGTALHWAAWCGRHKLVAKLVEAGANIHQKCIDFKSTPLFWAVHGLKKGDANNLQNHLQCIQLLIDAGADKTTTNLEGVTIFDLAEETDAALKAVLGSRP